MTLFADAYDVGRRTARVLPSFVILAVLSVSIAYLCRVPADQLAVVALIPPLSIFVTSRALAFIPRPTDEERQKARASFGRLPIEGRMLVWLLALETFFAPGVFLSAGLYYFIGLPGIGMNWIKFTIAMVGLAPISIGIVVLIQRWLAPISVGIVVLIQRCIVVLIQHCRFLFRDFNLATWLPIAAGGTGEIIYFPTRIANAVSTHIHWAHLSQ